MVSLLFIAQAKLARYFTSRTARRLAFQFCNRPAQVIGAAYAQGVADKIHVNSSPISIAAGD